MVIAMYEKQQKSLTLEDYNGVELPILGDGAGNRITDNTGAVGVDNTTNIANNPYLDNKPYRNLSDDDETDNNFDGNGGINILVNPAPTAAAGWIIDVDK